MITYKVWVHVERVYPHGAHHDLSETGEYAPLEAAHLDDLRAALRFAEELAGRKADELLDGYSERVIEEE